MTPEEDRALRDAISEATSETEDDERYWAAVDRVRAHGSLEMFKRVASLATSEDPRERTLVPDVLRFLGGNPLQSEREGGLPFREETIQLFRTMLATEQDERVIASIGFANCDLDDPRIADMVLPFRNHRSAEVRLGVVNGLMNGTAEAVRRAMIELTCDANADVRNWATFALASILVNERGETVDGEEVRSALLARANDSHTETHAEATLGLARRGDRRAIPMAHRGLTTRPFEWDQYIEAAELLADPSFYEALLKLKGAGRSEEELAAAITACGRSMTRS